jgi:hypothetical protein
MIDSIGNCVWYQYDPREGKEKPEKASVLLVDISFHLWPW